jgi:hypothetical protein
MPADRVQQEVYVDVRPALLRFSSSSKAMMQSMEPVVSGSAYRVATLVSLHSAYQNAILSGTITYIICDID